MSTTNGTKPSTQSASKRRYSLRNRARRLLNQGLDKEEVRAQLALSEEAFADLLRPRRAGPNELDSSSWRAFLEANTRDGEEGERLVFGLRLGDSASRSWFRWCKEGVSADIFTADAFLCRLNQHIDLYFDWCEQQEVSPWARGVAPPWHGDDPTGTAKDDERRAPAPEATPRLTAHHLDHSPSEAESRDPDPPTPDPDPDTRAADPPKPNAPAPRSSRAKRPSKIATAPPRARKPAPASRRASKRRRSTSQRKADKRTTPAAASKRPSARVGESRGETERRIEALLGRVRRREGELESELAEARTVIRALEPLADQRAARRKAA